MSCLNKLGPSLREFSARSLFDREFFLARSLFDRGVRKSVPMHLPNLFNIQFIIIGLIFDFYCHVLI
jgi:hypothetical protein